MLLQFAYSVTCNVKLTNITSRNHGHMTLCNMIGSWAKSLCATLFFTKYCVIKSRPRDNWKEIKTATTNLTNKV